jgi:hypothetical protein
MSAARSDDVKMRCSRLALSTSPLLVGVGLVAGSAWAAIIEVAPTDSHSKIEAAKAGDEVIINPGTYTFRVYLTAAAPANNPILIHAKDPLNPPVWDLSAGNVESAPGSYTAGDRGRGCWQFSGATNIQVSDIVITGCHSASHNSSGVRYYNASKGIKLTNVLFHDNDNGLTGGTEGSDIAVEFCEFAQNGTLLASSSAPSHNIYIYGGTFALRYSYAHDPIQAQNFHIRAKESTIEYNWFSRAKSYPGDLMTDDDNDGSSSTQNMMFRGNVIVQGSTQSNNSQIIAVYNDAGASNLTLNVKLLYNTFVGNGGHAALVHLSNGDGTQMSAYLANNIIYGTNTPTLVEDSAHGTVTGSNNWLVTGTTATGLTGSVFGSDPGFKNASQNDFTLASGSQAIGAALDSVSGVPVSEYYRDETVKCSYRQRLTAKDIGAFESTTQGAGIGPHGTGGMVGTGGASSGGGVATGGSSQVNPATGGAAATGGSSQAIAATGGAATFATGGAADGGAATLGGTTSQLTAGAGTAGGAGAPASDSGSCSCKVPGRAPGSIVGALTMALISLFGVRIRRKKPQ